MSDKHLILLHGALGSEAQLTPLKNILADQFTVHTLNFEGHGKRESTQDFSIDRFTENVRDFILENGLQGTHIFGYSMGGYVGLSLAAKYPSLFAKLVTLGTKFDWTRESAEKEVKMLNPDIIAEKVPKFAAHLQNVHGTENWRTVLQKTAGMMLDLGNGSALKAQDFTAIAHQVLICIGTLDNMVSIEESENTVDYLRNGQLKTLEGFIHPIEKNDQQELATIIHNYIST